MGGKRQGAGRHKRGCECERCQGKGVGSRPTDASLARKLKAKIKAEERWLKILEVEIELMEKKQDTGPLKRTLMYLDDRDLGKPMDTVNHIHKEPLQIEATVKISEIVREVRERKMNYERSRNS